MGKRKREKKKKKKLTPGSANPAFPPRDYGAEDEEWTLSSASSFMLLLEEKEEDKEGGGRRRKTRERDPTLRLILSAELVEFARRTCARMRLLLFWAGCVLVFWGSGLGGGGGVGVGVEEGVD